MQLVWMQLYLDLNHEKTPCVSNYQKWPHFTTRITTMEFVANLQQSRHEWKPMIVDKKFSFYHMKRK